MKSRSLLSLLIIPLSLLFVVPAAFGQSFGFKWNGEALQDGAVISVPVVAEDYGGGFFIVEGSTNTGGNNLQIVNTGSSTADITVVGKVEHTTTSSAIAIQLRAGGDCTRDTQGKGIIEKNAKLAAGASVPARWEVDFGDVSNYGEVETTLSLASGSTSVAISVKFVYETTGIRTPSFVEGEWGNTPVYDLLGRRISSKRPLAPGLYIIGGRKVVVKAK